MDTILIVFAILVVGIIIAAAVRGRNATTGTVTQAPPMGLLNPGGGWISPINGNEAAKNGCRIVAMSTPNYSYHLVEPARRVTVRQADVLFDYTDGARRLRGVAREDIASMGS